MIILHPRKLFDCPVEIIESIISDIVTPKDLLNLALTCKALCARIIPYHIQFRILKVNLHEYPLELGDALLQHKTLLSRYRKITLRFSKSHTIIPCCLLPNTIAEAPASDNQDFLFQHVMPRMILDLRSLISHARNLTTLSTFITGSGFLSFLRLLASSTPLLVSLELCRTSPPGMISLNEDYYELLTCTPLLQLRRVKLSEVCIVKNSKKELIDGICCLTPNLSSFEIDFDRPTAELKDLLQRATWPHLTSVLIYMFMTSDPEDSEVFISFLNRHPTITSLAVSTYETWSPFQGDPLTREILPNLRKLSTTHLIQDVVSVSMVDQLTHVCAAFDYISMTHLEEMKNLKQCIANVDVMMLCDILKVVPLSVEKLIIEKLNNDHGDSPDDEWINGLRLLHKHKQLTHIGGLNAISTDDALSTSPSVIQELRRMPQVIKVSPLLDTLLIDTTFVEVFFKDGEITEQMCKWFTIDELTPELTPE
ncbi:hypothetical protein M422DRAFT_249619 [Sphaerobolus stellatus SS14]|uniref:F-box domain-containing protein n=1 Tax=Sphaerobolus stellatus (strain SS14) TaxID=990650 RepID=A0A0C9UUY2_SPHS4|nr:hypothetical protein M422DRAFT_249619 [Sphaerobolus stellatus SS14]